MKPGTLCKHRPTGVVLVISNEMVNLIDEETLQAIPCAEHDDGKGHPLTVPIQSGDRVLYASPFLCAPYRKDELDSLGLGRADTGGVMTALFRIFRQD